jgi:hypothetical protein
VDPEQQAHDVSFICEPWRWVGHLYLPLLTAVSIDLMVMSCTGSGGIRCAAFLQHIAELGGAGWATLPAFLDCGRQHSV